MLAGLEVRFDNDPLLQLLEVYWCSSLKDTRIISKYHLKTIIMTIIKS